MTPVRSHKHHTDHGKIYGLLLTRFGELHWWPGDTGDEVLIGAILTQNTSWKNVEKSIIQLKARSLLSVDQLANIREDELQDIIRSSGFFRQKSRYLIAVALAILKRYGSLESMRKFPLQELQSFLSSLPGIGTETMDSILLYALDKRTFVVDAYTLRILNRIDMQRSSGLEEIKLEVLRNRNFRISSLKNYHAMFVELGKTYCRKKPLCENCPLNQVCDYAIDLSSP